MCLLGTSTGPFYAEAVHTAHSRLVAPRSAPAVSTAAASLLRPGASERVSTVGRQAIPPEAEDGRRDIDGGEDSEDEQRRHTEVYGVGPQRRGRLPDLALFALAKEAGDVVMADRCAG